jgi:hypothetical protein
MTYLDYLPDTPYAELPASAKTEISEAEYAKLQVLGASLSEPASLPSALGLALAAKVEGAVVPPTPASSAVAKTSGVHAGWRLAAVLSVVGLLGFILYSAFPQSFGTFSAKIEPTPAYIPPTPQTIERVVIQRDTVERVVRDTITLYRTKVELREVRDTVYLRRDVPIAEAEPVNAEEIQDASKSLSTGLNWSELTVRGAGEFSEIE